jgi:hypothetical protein
VLARLAAALAVLALKNTFIVIFNRVSAMVVLAVLAASVIVPTLF